MKILMIRHPETEPETEKIRREETERFFEKAEAFQREYLLGRRAVLVSAPEACCRKTLEVLTARRTGIPFAVTKSIVAEDFRERGEEESEKEMDLRVQRQMKSILLHLAVGAKVPPEVLVLSGHRSTLLAIGRGFLKKGEKFPDPAAGAGIAAELVLAPGFPAPGILLLRPERILEEKGR